MAFLFFCKCFFLFPLLPPSFLFSFYFSKNLFSFFIHRDEIWWNLKNQRKEANIPVKKLPSCIESWTTNSHQKLIEPECEEQHLLGLLQNATLFVWFCVGMRKTKLSWFCCKTQQHLLGLRTRSCNRNKYDLLINFPQNLLEHEPVLRKKGVCGVVSIQISPRLFPPWDTENTREHARIRV